MALCDTPPWAAVPERADGSARPPCRLGGPCENQLVMVLPDVLGPGLRVVFCGTAAGSASACRGADRALEKFWPILYAVELTPRQLRPADFVSALEDGIGLTDLCKLRSGSDLEIGDDAYDVAGLETRLLAVAPRVIAFNGLKAGREALGRVDGYGNKLAASRTLRPGCSHLRQAQRIAGGIRGHGSNSPIISGSQRRGAWANASGNRKWTRTARLVHRRSRCWRDRPPTRMPRSVHG